MPRNAKWKTIFWKRDDANKIGSHRIPSDQLTAAYESLFRRINDNPNHQIPICLVQPDSGYNDALFRHMAQLRNDLSLH